MDSIKQGSSGSCDSERFIHPPKVTQQVSNRVETRIQVVSNSQSMHLTTGLDYLAITIINID